MASLLRASILLCARGPAAAQPVLALAESELEAREMRLYAAVARRTRGHLQAGADGRALQLGAEDVFAAEGIVNAEAFFRLLAPGLPW